MQPAPIISGQQPLPMHQNPLLSDDTHIFDQTHLVSQFMDNSTLCKEIIGVMLEELPIQLTHLTQALESGDVTRAHRTAHSLKGAAANIGANELQRAAKQLEMALTQNQIPDTTPTLLKTVEQSAERLRSLLESRGF